MANLLEVNGVTKSSKSSLRALVVGTYVLRFAFEKAVAQFVNHYKRFVFKSVGFCNKTNFWFLEFVVNRLKMCIESTFNVCNESTPSCIETT